MQEDCILWHRLIIEWDKRHESPSYIYFFRRAVTLHLYCKEEKDEIVMKNEFNLQCLSCIMFSFNDLMSFLFALRLDFSFLLPPINLSDFSGLMSQPIWKTPNWVFTRWMEKKCNLHANIHLPINSRIVYYSQ